jgi:hypothetical protein
MKNEILPVIFRMWNGVHGDVFALFPTMREGDGCIASYQRIGQHCAADYDLCIKRSRPATPAEYSALADELKIIGYSFRIVARRSRQMRECTHA